jgi:hypothetical protein
MIVAKMPPADVPVKILGFHIQREHIGEQSAQIARYFFNRVAAQIRWYFSFVCHGLVLPSINFLVCSVEILASKKPADSPRSA